MNNTQRQQLFLLSCKLLCIYNNGTLYKLLNIKDYIKSFNVSISMLYCIVKHLIEENVDICMYNIPNNYEAYNLLKMNSHIADWFLHPTEKTHRFKHLILKTIYDRNSVNNKYYTPLIFYLKYKRKRHYGLFINKI